jgi:hypothetical protein
VAVEPGWACFSALTLSLNGAPPCTLSNAARRRPQRADLKPSAPAAAVARGEQGRDNAAQHAECVRSAPCARQGRARPVGTYTGSGCFPLHGRWRSQCERSVSMKSIPGARDMSESARAHDLQLLHFSKRRGSRQRRRSLRSASTDFRTSQRSAARVPSRHASRRSRSPHACHCASKNTTQPRSEACNFGLRATHGGACARSAGLDGACRRPPLRPLHAHELHECPGRLDSLKTSHYHREATLSVA